jgi:hypothetical protein
MKNQLAVDWNAACLVVACLALALVGVFLFGSVFNQVQAVLVVTIFVLGLAGVYSLSRK